MLRHDKQCNLIKRCYGYSLTELLVACSLASLVIAAVATQAAQSHIAHSSIQHATSVEDDMRALQSTITQHLSKAGYIYSNNTLSPFSTTISASEHFKITTGHRESEPENSCVMFSYDKNSDGVVSLSQGEWFGYRLNNKAIEYRVAGSTCDQSGWFDLTDTQTTVATKFSVNLKHATSWGSTYEIEIALRSKVDPTVTSSRKFIVEATNAYE